MKIKILLIFIISTMLMFSMPSRAGEEISYDLINQEAVKTAKNVPFDMDIILRQADQVVGYQLKIIYDHTRFTFNELKMNTQLSTPVYNSDILGEITINYSNIGNPIQGDTTLFTLNFTPYLVEDHQFYQVITLDLEYHHEITMINDTFQMSSTSLIYDHFSDVYVGVFGDISGDGIVSILDVGLLQLHLAGLNELSPSELKLLDANQDGLISLIDVTMMQLFIAHKIHYIGPKINYYMQFNTMGGSSIDMQVYDYNQLINPIPIPTKEDHMFDGWFLDEGYTMEFNYETMPAYDLILYAKWIEFDQGSYDIDILMWSGDGTYYEDLGSLNLSPSDLAGQNHATIYAVAKAFKEIYPNVRINVYLKEAGPNDGHVSWEQERENFKNTYGRYPSIWSSNNLVSDVMSGLVADLSIYSHEKIYQSFNPTIMQMMNYYGVQAGLPQYLLPWGVYVNKELADQNNISVPSVNWTIDEYTYFVSQADGINFWGSMETPFSFIFSGTTTMAAQIQNYSGTGDRIHANSAEVRALIPYIHTWADTAIWPQRDLGNVPDQVMNDNWWWGYKFFMENKILTHDGDPWMMGDGAHPNTNHWARIKSNHWDIYPRPSTPYQGNSVGVVLDPLAVYNFALQDGNPTLSEQEAKHQAMAYRFASFWVGDDRAWTARANQQFLDGENLKSAMNDSLPLVTGEAFDRQMEIWYSIDIHQRFSNEIIMPGFHEVLRLFKAGQIYDISDKTNLSYYHDNGMMRPILYEWQNAWNPAVLTGNPEATSPRRTDTNWTNSVLDKLPEWNTLFNQRFVLVDTSLRQALQTYYGKNESDFN